MLVVRTQDYLGLYYSVATMLLKRKVVVIWQGSVGLCHPSEGSGNLSREIACFSILGFVS